MRDRLIGELTLSSHQQLSVDTISQLCYNDIAGFYLGENMKTIIHINQHNIRHNINCDPSERKSVITCKTYKTNIYADSVVIADDRGKEIARVVYSPDKPLSCGARVWIEVDSNNVLVEEGKDAPVCK